MGGDDWAQGSLAHFDGTSWTNLTNAIGVPLFGVSGAGGAGVWLVGANGSILRR